MHTQSFEELVSCACTPTWRDRHAWPTIGPARYILRLGRVARWFDEITSGRIGYPPWSAEGALPPRFYPTVFAFLLLLLLLLVILLVVLSLARSLLFLSLYLLLLLPFLSHFLSSLSRKTPFATLPTAAAARPIATLF